MTTYFHQRFILLLMALCVLNLLSCDKSNNDELNFLKEGSHRELILDSLYYYSKEVYLWNDAIPSYDLFSPRTKYADIEPNFNAYSKAIFDLSQLKVNEVTGFPYEYFTPYSPKYSFIEERSLTVPRTVNPTDLDSYLSFDLISNDVAYIQLSSFPPLTNLKPNLDDIFDKIADSDATLLFLDLRANMGGYLETAEYLVNLIAPKKLDNKIMYSEYFNETLRGGNLRMLQKQIFLDNNGNPVNYKGRWANMADIDYSEAANTHYFKKERGINNIDKLYVITSSATASASEFLINILKPHVKLEVIGEKTFGKPTGTFAISIDVYDVYLANFLIKNSEGDSDYFEGLSPDVEIAINNVEDLNRLTDSIISANVKTHEPTRTIKTLKSKLKLKKNENNTKIKLQSGNIENRLKLKKQ